MGIETGSTFSHTPANPRFPVELASFSLLLATSVFGAVLLAETLGEGRNLGGRQDGGNRSSISADAGGESGIVPIDTRVIKTHLAHTRVSAPYIKSHGNKNKRTKFWSESQHHTPNVCVGKTSRLGLEPTFPELVHPFDERGLSH